MSICLTLSNYFQKGKHLDRVWTDNYQHSEPDQNSVIISISNEANKSGQIKSLKGKWMRAAG